MFRRQRNLPAPDDDSRKRGREFAWKTHSAITDWTAKVDTKASIMLSLGGVLLGFIVTLSGAHRALANLAGWSLMVERVGLLLVALAVLCAGLVVAPRLNRRQSRKIWRSHFVYFGHLRRWKPEHLKRELESLSPDRELEILSAQLISTSKIAWYKHSLLQGSIGLLIIGVCMITLAVVWT